MRLFSFFTLISVLVWIFSSSFVLRDTRSTPTSMTPTIGVFVINLDRSPERLEHITPLAKELNWPTRRIQAVDANSLTQETIDAVLDEERFYQYRGRMPKTGEIGCALSHQKALSAFLETDLEYALILEDDVEFSPPLLQKIIGSAIQMPEYWDVLALQLNHRGLPSTQWVLDEASGSHLVKYYGHIVESGAYCVNRKAAHLYLAKFFPILLPFDYFFTREWEFGLKFRGVEPRPVEQVLPYSYIDNTDILKQNLFKNDSTRTLLSRLSKYWFNFRSDCMRFIYTVFAN